MLHDFPYKSSFEFFFFEPLTKKVAEDAMFWQKKKIKLETRSKSVRPFLLSEIGHPGKNNFTPSLQEVVLRACEKKSSV